MKQAYIDHFEAIRQDSPQYTYRYLEKETGISASTIQRWFAGKGTPPVDDLERVFEAMGSSMQQVFTEVGEKEMRDSAKLDYKGANALLDDFKKREASLVAAHETEKEHLAELRKVEKEAYETATRKQDDVYKNVTTHLKQQVKELEEKNKELSEKASNAEKERERLDARRHHVFWAMLVWNIIQFSVLCIAIAYFAWEVMHPFEGLTEILLAYYGITPGSVPIS